MLVLQTVVNKSISTERSALTRWTTLYQLVKRAPGQTGVANRAYTLYVLLHRLVRTHWWNSSTTRERFYTACCFCTNWWHLHRRRCRFCTENLSGETLQDMLLWHKPSESVMRPGRRSSCLNRGWKLYYRTHCPCTKWRNTQQDILLHKLSSEKSTGHVDRAHTAESSNGCPAGTNSCKVLQDVLLWH